MDYQKAYADLMLADRVSLRERVVMEVYRLGDHYADSTIKTAEEIVNYIERGKVAAQPKGQKRRGRPPKIETVVLAKTKRKYTKRSPKWKK